MSDDVIRPTQDEWDALVARSLAELGITYDELAEQARTSRFQSTEAKQLWIAIGPSAAPEVGGEALGAQRRSQRADEANACTCHRQIRDDMAAEIADAIEAHREGWASTHPHHAFGEGLDTAARIAREHITQPPANPSRARD